MPILQDKAYFAARAAKARSLARAASDIGIRGIHLQMAERYDILAQTGLPPSPANGPRDAAPALGEARRR